MFVGEKRKVSVPISNTHLHIAFRKKKQLLFVIHCRKWEKSEMIGFLQIYVQNTLSFLWC